MSMKRYMLSIDDMKARAERLMTPTHSVDTTKEYKSTTVNLSDEPIVISDNSSFHEHYKDDQERYSQENVNIEPHIIADKISDSDIQSQTSTEQVASIKEREKAHTSTKDRKILTKRDMVPTDEKRPRDSGLVTFKLPVEGTSEYKTIMDNLSDQPIISSDTISLHEQYEDEDAKVFLSDTQDVHQQYSEEKLKLEPHSSAEQITDSEHISQTATKQALDIKEKEKTDISTSDKKMSMKRYMLSIDDMMARAERLMIPTHSVDTTKEYKSTTVNLSDEPIVISDTSSFHEHYKDDQERYSQENVNIEPHIIADKISDSDIQSQTSTQQVASIKEREKAHTSTKDRKILTKRDMVPTDEKRPRDSGLVTFKLPVEGTSEYKTIMDNLLDQPVISSDTISLHEQYKDEDAKVFLSDTQDVHQQYSEEKLKLEPHSSAEQITYSEHISQTATKQALDIKEKEKTDISTSDKKMSMKRYMLSIDDMMARAERLMIPTHSVDTTKEYKSTTVNLSDEPIVISDTSSFHEHHKDDQERYSQENVNIEPHIIADKISDSGIQSQTSTEQVTSIKEREKAHTSTKHSKILTKRDMVPTDEKRSRDSGLITFKLAVEGTAEYKRIMDNLSDQPGISSGTISLHEQYKDEDAKVFSSDTEDVHQQYSKKKLNVEPHSSAEQITDSEHISQTATKHLTGIKETEKTQISTSDKIMSMKRYMLSIDDMRARAERLMIPTHSIDTTKEYKSTTVNLSDEPIVISDTSSFHQHYKDDQERYSQENVNIEPHIIADKISDSDIQSQTSTEQVASIKEREQAHTSTKERKIFTKKCMVQTDEKRPRDSRLITFKLPVEGTSEYKTIMDNLSDQPIISSDTISLHEQYEDEDAKVFLSDTQDVHQQYSEEKLKLEPHSSAEQITDSEHISQTATKQTTGIKETEKTQISTSDKKMSMKRYVLSIDDMRARAERLMIPTHSIDTTKEYKSTTVNLSDEPIVISDTSSFHEHYKDDQERYSQENVNIEPHIIADKISDSDIQSQTSTEQVASIKEREKAHTSTKDRKILTKKDMVPTDEKRPRDSGLITFKLPVEGTSEYKTIMDNQSDQPVISSDTFSLHEQYKDEDAKVFLSDTQDVYQQYSKKNVNVEPHSSAEQMTDRERLSKTATKQTTGIKETEKTQISTSDKKMSMKRYMLSIDDMMARAERLMIPTHSVDTTKEYKSTTVNLSDEPIVISDTSSFHEHHKDVQERYIQENVNIEPHIIADKISDSDIQFQTSTEQVASIKEREKAHTSTKYRKILTKRDMVTTDEKRPRDSGLITFKLPVEGTSEYKTIMDNQSDQPVISSDTFSRHEQYKDEDAKVFLSDTQDVCQQYSKKNVNVEPHSSAEQMTDRERLSKTATKRTTGIKETEKTQISTSDKKMSMKRYMLSINDMMARAERLMIPTHSVDTTKEYKSTTVNLSDEPIVISDTSSFHEHHKDVQERYIQENVNIEPHIIADKISDSDIPFQTSTEQVESIKEREKAHTSRKDRKILTKRDMVPTDEKRPRDSGLITFKLPVEGTSEYKTIMDNQSDQPVISSDTFSRHEQYKDEDAKVFLSDTQDVYQQYSKKNVNVEPHSSAEQMTDRERLSKTATKRTTGIKETEKTQISTSDKKMSMKRYMLSIDDMRARAERLMIPTHSVDTTKEYKSTTVNLSDEPIVISDTSSFHEHHKDVQERYIQENVNIEPHIIADKISDSDIPFQTSTEQVESIKEREKAHTSTKERKILTKKGMVPTDEKRPRDSCLITFKLPVEGTSEYKTIMDNLSDQPVISTDTSSLDQRYKDEDAKVFSSEKQDVHQQFREENVKVQSHSSAEQITDSEHISRTATKQTSDIKEKEKTHISTSDKKMSMKRYMLSIDDMMARAERLMTPTHLVDTTKEYKSTTVNLSDEPIVISDTSSFHEDYKDDQEQYSQENVNIEPHIIADKISDSDIQSQISTEQVTSIKERKKAHTSTKDSKILTKRDMVPTDENRSRDSGLITFKLAVEGTAEYKTIMDNLSDQPVISSGTISLHEQYKDEDAKVFSSHTEDVHQQYSEKKLNVEPHSSAEQITDTEHISQTATKQTTGIKETEKTQISTSDKKMSMKRYMLSIDDMRARAERLMLPTHSVDTTKEYKSTTVNLSDEPIVISDTSSSHEHYKDDQERYSQENVDIEPHIIADKISDSDIQFQTSTEQVASIKERDQGHTSTKERKILTKKGMVPTDKKRPRDSGLITFKLPVEGTSEYKSIMDNLSEQPVISTYTSSLDQRYKDEDAKVFSSETQDVHQQFREENVKVESHSSAEQITDSEHLSKTATKETTGIKENVNIEPHIIADKISDSDIQSQISTEQVTSIKKREKAHTSTKDSKILTKRDMVPTDEKRSRDSGLITFKLAVEGTAEYKTIMDNLSDQPVISSGTISLHEQNKDEDAKVFLSNTQDVHQQFSEKKLNVEPHSSAEQITDSEHISQTATKQTTGIKETEKTHISTSDKKMSMKRYMLSIDDMNARAERLMTPTHSVDITKEYKSTKVNLPDEPIVISDTSLLHDGFKNEIQKVILSDSKEDQKRYSKENLNIKPHTITCKIIDNGKQSQTSPTKITSIGKREKAHSSKIDIEILKKSDMVPIDQKKERDSCPMTCKPAVDDTAEYNTKMDNIMDAPVMLSDTSSLHEDYKDDQQKYSKENVKIEHYTIAGKISDGDNQFQTSTKQITNIQEKEKRFPSRIDRKILTKRDIVPIDENKARDSGLITSKQAEADTAEFNTIMNNIWDEIVISSDTSSLHEDNKDDQKRYSKESVKLKHYTIADKISDVDHQTHTSTEQITRTEETEKVPASTIDRKILTKKDMVPIDEKKARDSCSITSKPAVDDTAEYNRIIENNLDAPVMLSDTKSFHEDNKDDQKKYRQENVQIKPHTIVDGYQFLTSSEEKTSRKEREKTHISSIDRKILTKKDMVPIDKQTARDSCSISSKPVLDDTAEFKTLINLISTNPLYQVIQVHFKKVIKMNSKVTAKII
ncbi:unnamed protein product [Mytilus coruscus]|uniref:Uncharacterized protein n=1 Tax=Mytilus coruscus TaxID=42192 RepID=A0A6J8DZD9_MYTCO|nr:unnamed protein product [Mytilus coruscus]